MPYLRDANPAMPLSANRVHRAIATTTRVDVIRRLRASPHSTRPELVTALGIGSETIRDVLDDLEQLGYVSASPNLPRKHRRGRIVKYELRDDLFLPHLDALYTYLRGADNGHLE